MVLRETLSPNEQQRNSPQSCGRLTRLAAIESLKQARRKVADYVEHYNHSRLHSAIGYVAPADKLNGLEEVIFAQRDRKIEEARERRQQARQAARKVA